MFDAVSLAVKAALFNTKIPRVTAALMDGGNVDLSLSDDPYDCNRIEINQIPILVTVCKIGDSCVVDPSAEEEQCSAASVVVGVSQRDNKSKLWKGCFCKFSTIFGQGRIAFELPLEPHIQMIKYLL